MSTYDALGLHQFGERTGAPTAIAMRRLRRKGADFELSGDEVFRELTLPLTKAFQHYSELIQANRGPTQLYYDVHCIGLLGVLRAPMVGVQTVDNEVVIESLPWIRVVRIDPGPEADQAYSTATVLDAVHIDMLPEYVAHMYAVAAGCARRVSSNSVAVISGEALWRESSEEDVGSDDAEQKVVDDLEFRKLEPTVSAEEFLNQWRDRFHELHSRSDGDAPMARIARYEPRRP